MPSRGTEFSDAETGGQDPPERPFIVRRRPRVSKIGDKIQPGDVGPANQIRSEGVRAYAWNGPGPAVGPAVAAGDGDVRWICLEWSDLTDLMTMFSMQARCRCHSRAETEAWSIRMEGYGGPAQPSPTIRQCINGRLVWLEVECNRCKTRASFPLDAIRRSRDTPIWKLEAEMQNL
jgi:hypothetical protein